MAILTIDGWEIPVESVTRGVEYLDTYKRAFSGNLRDGTRFAKRKWDVTTAYLNQDDARTLRALIHNEGDRLSANHILGSTKWDNDSKNFLVSNKGNVIGASNVATYRPFEGPNDTHAFALEPDTTNLFKNDSAVNPSLEGTLSGGGTTFTLSGFTISATNLNVTQDTENPYHGTKALKMSYKAGGGTAWKIFWNNYVTKTITDLGLAVGDTITFSWYERHNIDLSTISGADYIPQLKFYDTNKKEIAGTAVSLTSLGPTNLNWHRHSITATIPANTVYLLPQVGFDSPDFTINQYYYIDALQLEKAPYATSFIMDTRTSTSGTMPFVINYNTSEISIFVKVKPSGLSASYAFPIQFTNDDYAWIYRCAANSSSHRFDIYFENGSTKTFITAIENLWDNLVLVYNYSTSIVRIYRNGTKVTEVAETRKLYPNVTTLSLSPDGNFLISEIYILPIAVSDSFAKAYTSSWLVPNNNLLVSGDCANGQVVPCYAELGDTETASYWQGGTVYLAEKVRFTLYEI